MRSLRVLILYNEPVLPSDHSDAESEREVLETAEVVRTNLVQAGFQVVPFGISRDPDALLARVRTDRPDVIFNLFEGTADDGDTEAYLAGLLEWLGIPFTGSPFQTLCLARNKHLTKTLLQGASLPSPRFFVVNDLPVPRCPLDWPVIIKPATQDASIGLDQGSVVGDLRRLTERVTLLLKNYGPPVLVEQFIPGRELNVAVVQTEALNLLLISEIQFRDKDPGFWPIVTYNAKWKPGSRDDVATPACHPADITPQLAERVRTISRQAYRLLGCRDYARVDFRVSPEGEPYILEVNPNPDLHPTAGLANALACAGVTHVEFTADLARTALARGKTRIGRCEVQV